MVVCGMSVEGSLVGPDRGSCDGSGGWSSLFSLTERVLC